MKTFVKSVVNTKDELFLRRIQYNEIFQIVLWVIT